ncbi:MAG: hypothetical protein EOO80_08745 [Oxalobacteraceae bacterium]|nr:MAG: hypothetical protein EOO80_08745 [Oxalobacteraceae bacterium]
METRVCPSTVYREHTILFNPSGTEDGAVSDAFMILEPSANPMFTSMLYEHPKDQVQVYGTEAAAYDAVMAQAKRWIDAYLDDRKTSAPGALTR